MPAANAERAKQLRQGQTDVERKLWLALRDRRPNGAKFRRQVPISSYIADFVCVERKLIVELDGGQHGSQTIYDARRTHALIENGYRVIRFWNNEVIENLEGVMTIIQGALDS